jgi:hypothetical protein
MVTPYRLSGGKDGDFGLGFITASIDPNAGPYAMVSSGGGAATWRLAIPQSLAFGKAALYEPALNQAASRPTP